MKNNAISLPDSSATAARPTVLIVDDSRLMRVAIKKILKDEFELIEAVDGEDAWSRLMEEPAIACIFSDLSMPNLDGYGLLARVRGSDDAHVRALPFIVITGKEGDLGGLLEEVRGHGATDLVGKPFKSDEIIARTRSLLAVDTPTPEAPTVNEAPAVDQAAEAEACRIRAEQEAARQAKEILAHRQAAEAEARRQKEEAEARRVQEEQEAARQAEAEQRRQVEEAARRQAAETEARRQKEEAEARRVREEQEAARRAEVAARQAAEQAEQERLAAEAAARQAEEEARICEELRAKARLMAEERERQRLAEEQALRLNPLQRLFVRLALPFMSLANRLLRLGKDEALEKLRKRLR
ncbi:MAG: response regulator [Gammaproteobacteria bacterium]